MYCVISYHLNGEMKTWPVDAHPTKDNEETLTAHLKRWLPDAEFISYTMDEPEDQKVVE